MPLVGLVGLVGNVLSVVVLSARDMNNSFNKLLIALAVFDSTFIVFVVFDYTVVRGEHRRYKFQSVNFNGKTSF